MSSQSHELTHKVLTGIDEAYWQWDLVNESIFYSAQLMKILGYENKEKIGTSVIWEKHLDRNTLEDVHSKIQQHLKGEMDRIDITIPIVNNQGHKLWLHAVGKVVEHIDGRASLMFGTVKDVTETKNMIVQLKKQNDWLMLAERISNSGHWRFDIQSATLDWSAEVFRIHGLTNKSIVPTFDKAVDVLLAKDRAKFRTSFHNAIHQQQPFYLKTALTQPSGKKIKVEVIAEVERDSNGIALAVFGVYKDITRSEDLFEKLKLLAMVNFTIKVPIFFIDDNDNVVYQDISPHHDGISAVLFNYINFSITEYMEFKKLAKKQGQIKENNVSFDKYTTVFDLSVTYEADEGIYIWIVENVTDKFRTEQQQVISNRLALLGNTFGNVSHDINNVLGVALGAIEMLEIKFSRGEDISDYIDRVKNAIDKGKDVTERLLAFTRRPTVKVVSFDPIQDIFDNQYLFKQLLLSTIKITFNFQPMHCLINFPQGEFINILLNLVLNAQDAIQEKGLSGHIEISANLLDNNRLEIHVKDSGIGIEKENLTKIFDPFYSSKSVNKGNGIGLANVYSTMYKHNGLIQVEGYGALGGAHFTLVFKCKVLREKFLANEPKSNTLRYKNTNILVLDDEVSIAEFVALFLESKGANVVVANNKKELIDRINSDIGFDIFITDMILPDLSGKEAVNLVMEKFPDINVFSISGYIAIEDRSWDYPVLRKPFNSKELAEFLAM
ncbi:ATP-binding protein [Colwellia sp. TT2012]|uniref:ATP-binding protein n=1 Tax=Colwellia sp. TT2012 TaxID=1720342 RepID=UPI000708D7FD|nr:ATP-binding protein [Colwellia sp. TT2012]